MKRMRRILAAVICLVMVASFVPMASAATVSEGMCGDNVSWTLDDNGVLTISGTGPMSDTLVLSEEDLIELDGKALVYEFMFELLIASLSAEEDDVDLTDEESLEAYLEAYYEENMAQEFDEYMSPWAESGVKSIVIEEGVTSIGAYAFWGCDVESVTIADSVTTIGDGAFAFCGALTSVTIPEGVTSIGAGAFMVTSLASITIPNGVTNIEDGTFSWCTELASVTIPEGVTSIGYEAFSWCTELESVMIPNSVTSIESYTFENCISLESVTIPSSVTSIGDGAFERCTSLKSVTIPEGVTSVGYWTFYECTSLESVTIPSSVTSIREGAFSDCSSLTSVTIPNGVTSIEAWTFNDCSSLVSVTIPDSVTSIERWAFSDCSALTSVTIPEGVTSIGTAAFYYCDALESVTLPAGAPQQIEFLSFFSIDRTSDIDFGGSDDDIAVVVEDSLLIPDSAPYIKDGRTLVPMRAIFEALGCSVEWNNEERSVTAFSKDGDDIKMTIGDNVMYVNGTAVTLDVAAEITNSRTFVPVRAISEALGCEVEWDNDTRVVYITEETAEEE